MSLKKLMRGLKIHKKIKPRLLNLSVNPLGSSDLIVTQTAYRIVKKLV